MSPITSPLEMPLLCKYQRVVSPWMYSQSNSEFIIFIFSVRHKSFKQSSYDTPIFSPSAFVDLIRSQIVPPGMMIYPADNFGLRPFNFSLTAPASADLKGSTFQLLYLLLRVVGLGAGFE